MSYIELPITTDPDELTTDALDYLMDVIPGWIPQEGHLEVWLLEVLCRINAETRDVASRVPVSIFRYFGKSLLGLASIDAARATVDTTWSAIDDAGYTIPAGTVVAYAVSGDQSVYFEVVSEVAIPAGEDSTSVGEVELIALEPGTEGNGHSGSDFKLVDALAFVETITAPEPSAGGVEAETDEEYLARLRAELELLAPRPILPDDFAVLAQRIPGVERSTAIDGYSPPVNEKQQVAITGSPTGGTFTLTYSGQTTAGIAYNANAAAVQSALEALSNIGVGDVAVTGGALPGTAVVVEFTGALAGTNVSAMTASGASLTGGSSPAVAITTTQGGAAAATDQERIVSVAVADEDGETVSSGIKTAVDTYLESLRELNFVVHVIDPTYTEVDVTATLKAKPGADPTVVDAAATEALQEYLSPAIWNWSSTVRYNELISLLDQVEGVDYVDDITTPSGDVALSGVASLASAGTINITVDPA